MIEQLVLALMLVGITLYAVLGGADFGAGIWDLTAGSAKGGAHMRGVIERSMGPVWEANHVWLIFVLVVCWTAFPIFFGSLMSSLWIPMAIAAFGIILRGSAFALRGQAATINEARALGATFALSSVIVPFALGTVIGGIASGQVVYGNAATDVWTVFLNPFSIFVGVLAVVLCAYLAAIFLVGDATRMKDPEMVAAFRGRALISGSLAGLLALAGLPIAKSHATYLYDGLTSGMGLICVIASMLAGIVTLVMIWRGVAQWPRLTAAVAVGAVTAGWGFAQAPYLLPPGPAGSTLKLVDGAGNQTTLLWLVIAVVFALLFIVPSLAWLYKLTLTGAIEPAAHDYEKLDQPDKGVKPLP
jgi:cytochrome d ubiquinol oxidase subunit II